MYALWKLIMYLIDVPVVKSTVQLQLRTWASRISNKIFSLERKEHAVINHLVKQIHVHVLSFFVPKISTGIWNLHISLESSSHLPTYRDTLCHSRHTSVDRVTCVSWHNPCLSGSLSCTQHEGSAGL